jgi:hypothetical protein
MLKTEKISINTAHSIDTRKEPKEDENEKRGKGDKSAQYNTGGSFTCYLGFCFELGSDFG